MPKISVILTSFNHEKYICEAIDSVLNQTFIDFELIILDDCSSDNSWDLITKYTDPRIKAFRSEVNNGCAIWLNKTIFEVACGEYIAIHHSDDVWVLDKLEKQVAFLVAHSKVGAVFTSVIPINELGMPLFDELNFYYSIFDQPNRSRHEWLRFFFLSGNALCHPSVLIRKHCYIDCGAYRDMLAQLTDFDMWIRLCAKYEIHVLEDPLVKFRILDNGMNTSGNRPEARIRCSNESYKLLQQYRSILIQDNIFKIFPDFISYDRGKDTDLEYVLARVCLESDDYFLRNLLAIDILFDILNDPSHRQAVDKIYGFSPRDFIEITGRLDLFSREETLNLRSSITERDRIIEEVHITVQEKDLLIEEFKTLMQSRSWRLTKPFRSLSKLLRAV